MSIEDLCDDILLSIFRLYLRDTPRFWPRLAWVCQKWRQIVLTSPLSLDLRLHCTYGTPVLKTLDVWSRLPIIVRYGGFPNFDPPALNDDDNIIAALKQFDRVCSIGLTVTKSLLKQLSAISESLSELEELSLLSPYTMDLTLPSTFRWGSRLRTLHSTRVAFPVLPQLLLPSQNLVDLQLQEVPSAGYFSPEAFKNALSGMTHLQILTLHFLSLPSRRNYHGLPSPSGERILLPTLNRFKYRGTSKYLDSLVSHIDSPRLGDIDITFFSQPTMDASQLGQFHRADRNADVTHSSRGSNFCSCHFRPLYKLKHIYISSITNIVQAVRLATILHGSSLWPIFPIPIPCRRAKHQ